MSEDGKIIANGRNLMASRVHQSTTHRSGEMRHVYAACEIGSTIKIVTSKGFIFRE